jgi:hypothetical protein
MKLSPPATGDDVDQLLVGMAVTGARPAALHAVLDQHHLLVVGQDPAQQARLRRERRHQHLVHSFGFHRRLFS